MAVLFECDCIGTDGEKFCSNHGKPIDRKRRLVTCSARCNHGRTQESMNEDRCTVCDGVGYQVEGDRQKTEARSLKLQFSELLHELSHCIHEKQHHRSHRLKQRMKRFVSAIIERCDDLRDIEV
jgi:hypothetical protein